MCTYFSSTTLAEENPRVNLITSEGLIEIELLPKFAPKHVANFLALVEKVSMSGWFSPRHSKLYDSSGWLRRELNYQPRDGQVDNESFNGLRNKRYTVAMARLSDPTPPTPSFLSMYATTHTWMRNRVSRVIRCLREWWMAWMS